MKSDHKVERYDYSKLGPNDSIDWDVLGNFHFWGIHKKNGRVRVDTKRFIEMCKSHGAEELLADGFPGERNTVYLLPSKLHRDDYAVNIFRDLMNELSQEWENEFGPIFSLVKTPEQVRNEVFSEEIAYSSAEDYDDVNLDADMAAFRREPSYEHAINSLYCQFIQKVCTESDRYLLYVLTKKGYKESDFNVKTFRAFTDGLGSDKTSSMIRELNKYNSWNLLHKLNNFLKHNSIQSYLTLKKLYPNNVQETMIVDRNETTYQNGMYAGDWIIVKEGYIDKILKNLLLFFEDYCKTFFDEDIKRAAWDYDDYFIHAAKRLKFYEQEFFGI